MKRVIILSIFIIFPLFPNEHQYIHPIVDISPVWVGSGSYGWYWGTTVSAGFEVYKRHRISFSFDIAPIGSVGMTDVATKGDEYHMGGTLNYHFQFYIARELFTLAPGITAGHSSIPFIYGTMYTDETLPNKPRKYPEREKIWSAGPALNMHVGRKRIKLLIGGRLLLSTNYNSAMLSNIGITVRL